jgi:DNA-directed RNA polymerase specialized sigma24 family protein
MKVEKWRTEMPAGIEKKRRENLIQEIVSVLGQWPERERIIFSQAHYQGHSVESISRAHQLDESEVRQILQLCERHLHASLRNPGKNDSDRLPLPAIEPARSAA